MSHVTVCDRCHSPIHRGDVTVSINFMVWAGKGARSGRQGQSIDLCLVCSLAFAEFLKPQFPENGRLIEAWAATGD